MRFLASYIMKGRLQAMTVAASLALVSLPFPPASIVSSAAVGLVTLRRGAGEGLYVLACACLAAAVMSSLLSIGYQFALLYGAVFWAPVWLIATILREGRLLALAIEIAVVLGLLGVLAFYGLQAAPEQVWGDVLSAMIQPMLDSNPDVPADQVKQSAQLFAHFMTGAFAAGIVYGMLFGLFLARWWQALLYNPGGFRAEFLALRGHRSLALISLAILATAFLSSGKLAEVSWNLLVVLFVLYSFIGTAVLHALFGEMSGARFWVPLLYTTLMLIPHVLIIVALCGVTDNWLNLRKKLSNSTTA